MLWLRACARSSKRHNGTARSFADGKLQDIPIGTGAYVVDDYEAGRYVSFKRNPDYWAKDLPLRLGTRNLDEMRIDFYGDQAVLFEAFHRGRAERRPRIQRRKLGHPNTAFPLPNGVTWSRPRSRMKSRRA